MNKFYKTKQTNIKINAHNKTNRTHKKNTKVYIHVKHNRIHNVCVVVIIELKNLQKTQKLETTQVVRKDKFHGVEKSAM